MSEITNSEWYQALVEECGAIFTETNFNVRWLLIEGYHKLGQAIIEGTQYQPEGILVSSLCKSLKRSERTLRYAVKFYKMFPDLDKLPEGKAATWNRIVVRYLTEHTPEPENHTHQWEQWRVCQCGHKERIG